MSSKSSEKSDPSRLKPKKKISKSKVQMKKKKRHTENYSYYIHKVLKEVYSDLEISSMAMEVMNGFVNDIFDRLASEAGRLAKYTKKSTVTCREIQASVRLVLPGELGRHAVSEGTKALTRFTRSRQ